jgi:hypothetical protein
MRHGDDIPGGVNARRLVKHVLASQRVGDVEPVWLYDWLKPASRTASEQIRALFCLEGVGQRRIHLPCGTITYKRRETEIPNPAELATSYDARAS